MELVRRLGHAGAIQALRHLPLPVRGKQALVWLLAPRRVVAAVAIIRDEQDRILLLRSAWLDRWQLPGGDAHLHETPLQAVCREVREETGRRVVTAARPTVVVGGAMPEVLFVYRVTLAPGPLQLSAEHTTWRYWHSSALPPEVTRLVQLGLRAQHPQHTVS